MIGRRKSQSRVSGIYRITVGRKIQLVLAFVVAQAFFFYSDCFRIHHITIEGGTRVDAKVLAATTGLSTDANEHLTEFSADSVRMHLDNILWVDHAEVSYRFPSEVRVEVSERHPAILVAEDDGRPGVPAGAWRSLSWYSADVEGLVLQQVERGQEGHFPRLLLDRLPQVRRKVNDMAVRKVLDWAAPLRRACHNNIAYFQVDAMGQVSFVTRLVGKPTLVRIGAPEKESRVQVLQLLCQRIEREGRPVDYVDLRFAYPAIRYPVVALQRKPPVQEGKAGPVQHRAALSRVAPQPH